MYSDLVLKLVYNHVTSLFIIMFKAYKSENRPSPFIRFLGLKEMLFKQLG